MVSLVISSFPPTLIRSGQSSILSLTLLPFFLTDDRDS